MHFSRRYNQTIRLPHPRVWRNKPLTSRHGLERIMSVLGEGLMRLIAGYLVLLLLVPTGFASPLPGQEQSSAEPAGHSAQATPSQSSRPESFPNSPSSMRSQVAENTSPFGGQQSTSTGQQAQEPVGTAAAESVETTGVAASKPAGAAIAPAKQRRTRSLLIKVGAIVGAGVAIGTVAALSSASPSRPPGAR